ncbi:ankyrin protein [Fusarium circinatum]|uniref:Ankyrin protein n=1 Tax=Fusarium circinatum TaxID=48490 RepID=A0A8H5ULS5_FUSCI|nr:ankyrin protein [Fusarium circinatum]
MPQAPRIPSAIWEAQRPRITELYVNQDKTLDEVIQIMAESGFHATKPQYIRKVNVNWKLQKNYTKEKWQQATALVKKRQAEGKLTELRIDGQVISEKRRKKELRRYHALQVEEDFEVGTSTFGVVASTPPVLNHRDVLINSLPWFNYQESFNNLSNNIETLPFSPTQNLSLDFEAMEDTLLFRIHTTGEMATGSLPQVKPITIATDEYSKHFDIQGRRLFELVPTFDNSTITLGKRKPAWLQIFDSLVFLCSNNLTCYGFGFLRVAISSGFLLKMKHLLTTRGPTVEIFAVHLLFVALGVKGSKGRGFMRFLFESGVSPSSIDPNDYRYSALHRAVAMGDHAAVQLLLQFGADPDADATMQDDNEETLGSPLSHAILHRSGTIVDMLIDAGADLNYGPEKPLIQAARKCNLELDTELMFLRSELLVVLRGQILTPIQFAVYEGAADIVNCLIKNGAVLDEYIEPEMLKRMGQFLHSGSLTPLQLSVQRGTDDITKILLDAGAGIDFRHPTKATALQIACGLREKHKNIDLIEYLLLRGADLDALLEEERGRTHIQTAAECGDYELFKLLLSKGGDPLAPASEKNGFNLFRAAIKSGSVRFVNYVFSEFGSQEGKVNCADGTNYLAEAISTGNMTLIDTVMVSWERLGLQWPKDFILSAIKVAIRKGLTDVIEVLDPGLSSIQQEDICSMICDCIWYGDRRTFDLLIQRSGKSKLDCAQPEYPTPLWLALHQGNDYMARRLINAGANPNQQSLAICHKGCCSDSRHEMPLKQAIYQFGNSLIEILANQGADIHCLVDGDQTPLLVSLERRNETAAILLLSKGADPNAVGHRDTRTALGLALDREASLSTVHALIHYGADVNRVSMWGTPLEQVAGGQLREHDTLLRCQLLLASGANVQASTGRTALQLAVDSDRLEIAKLLIEAGADINASRSRTTALESAVDNNNTRLAILLVEAGANVEASSVGTSVLQLAVSNKNVELVEYLINEGADINALGTKQNALQTAASLGNLELVKRLIDRGADVERSVNHLVSALQYASITGNIEIAKYLVEHGASVNGEPSPYYKATALGLAVASDHTQVAMFLMKSGASVNKSATADGATTLLQLATKIGNYELVSSLVENGAAVNTVPATVGGATALQYAAINGNIKMAAFLLENGARASAQGADIDGRTALEGAAEHGRLDMVYLLLENDEEPDTIDARCHNAANFAGAEHHDVIARILRRFKRP